MNDEGRQPQAERLTGEAAEFCPYCMSRVAPGQNCPTCGLTQGAYTPAPHHLPLGTILGGRYLVGRVLGEGGFGITYIGCDLRLEMKVAIKEYFPVDRVSRFADSSLSVVSRVSTTSGDYQQGLKRFLQEARTMARMEKQPEIVMVRDFFQANSTAYIVMEYVEGTNFMDLTAQYGGCIPPDKLFPLLQPLFSALGAVHAAGLIHRDISPDNLMLERGNVRLLDFGCARESARGTETMTIALKQGFAPIEQYQRKGQGPWTDVYALSATIYYCLTGKVPPQSLDRILEDELIPPRDLGVDITPGQQEALLRGMAIQPRRRYQTVEELYTGLYRKEEPQSQPLPMEDCGEQEAPLPMTEDAQQDKDIPPASQKKKGKGLAAIWASVAALALCVGLAVWVWNRAGGPGTATPGHSVSTVQPQLEREELFADAVSVSDGSELLAALADETVPAVVCKAGAQVSWFVDWGQADDGVATQLAVNKPLLVEDGGILEVNGVLNLTPGGVLWVSGQVNGMGALLTSGGSIVAEGQAVLNVPMSLDGAEDLIQDGTPSINGAVYLLSRPELFGNAVQVSTQEALQEAAEDPETSAIQVDGPITLTEPVPVRVPLWVSERGSLDAESAQGQLLVENALLVNEGTIQSGVWVGGDSAQIINRGTLDAQFGLWVDDGNGASPQNPLVNVGEIQTSGYNLLLCDGINYGTVTVTGEEEGAFNLDRCSWWNYGHMEVSGGHWEAGGEIYNLGSIQLGGSMLVAGLVKNNGRLTVSRQGSLSNQGLMDLYDYNCFLTVEQGGALDTNQGVLLTRSFNEIEGNIEGTVWSVDFTSIDGGEEIVRSQVSDAQQFLRALDDDSVETVVVTGDVTLEEDLTISKTVYLSGGSLTMAHGTSITVDGAILCNNGTLHCDSITVSHDAMMENIGTWTCEGESGQLIVNGKSWVYTRDGHLDLREVTVEERSLVVYDRDEGAELQGVRLSGESRMVYVGQGAEPEKWNLELLELDDSLFIQLGALTLSQANIQVDGGSRLHQCADLSLDSGTITVDSGGVFYSCCAHLTVGWKGVVENYGTVHTSDVTDITPAVVEGVVNNHGQLVLGELVEVWGTLDNQGQIYSFFDDQNVISVRGSGAFTGGTAIRSGEEWVPV